MQHRPRLRRRPSAGAYQTMTHAARQRAEQTYRRRCRLRDIRDFFPAALVAPAPEAQSEDDASRDWHFDLNQTDEEYASDDEADEAESPGFVSTVSSDVSQLAAADQQQAEDDDRDDADADADAESDADADAALPAPPSSERSEVTSSSEGAAAVNKP